jgi:hypothetical protein
MPSVMAERSAKAWILHALYSRVQLALVSGDITRILTDLSDQMQQDRRQLSPQLELAADQGG